MYRYMLRPPYLSVVHRSLCHRKRYYSTPPPYLRQAGFGKFIIFLTPIAVVGGAITYAKYDKEFRKTLEDNVPGAAYIIKVSLQEENPFKGVLEQFDNVKKQMDSVTTRFFGDSSQQETAKKAEASKTQGASIKKTIPKVEKAAEKASEKLSKEAPPSPMVTLPTNVVELEHAVELAASLALQEYNKAIDHLKKYNNEVRHVVEQSIENADVKLWRNLKNKTNARDTLVAAAEKLAHDALDKIEKCEVALAKAIKPDNHEQVMAVRNKIKNLVEHINSVKDDLYKNKDLANASEKFWKSVEQARCHYIDEIEAIFPGLDLSKRKLNINQEDFDLFLIHAYSHVLALQKELQLLQTDGELRLKRALDAVRNNDDSEATKAQLDYMLEKERRKLALENQKRINQIKVDAEKQLRQQLKQQAEAHLDHLQDIITMKESELKRQYSREMEDKMATEKANYKLQLATMLGKMRGMDAALQARAESERSAHQAQALWAACQALWSTVRTGEPAEHWKNKLRPLKNEIKAISKVSEGDELVAVVIQNLPPEAASRGVFPEDALRERFSNVERVARIVALVPEQGAALPKYFLSYLQSLFILRSKNPISDDELQNKQFDFSKLDTYDILNRARYYVEHGDLMMALKYMNLLQGAPRKIASGWLKETRLLLETQQAANTLMAHAAASGLSYL